MAKRAARAARRSSTPTSSTTPTSATTRRSSTTPVAPRKTRQPRTRIRLNTGDGNGGNDEVAVSSSVTIAPAGDDGSGDSSDDDAEDDASRAGGQRSDGNGGADNGNNSNRGGGGRDGRSPNDHTARGTGASPANPTQTADDELESMAWWDALTPGQQRAMMKRFVVQPPAPAPAPSTQQPIVIQAPPSSDQPRRHKMKRLHIEDFSGKSSESVEAWLATIPQEVERQAGLGGDSWTAEELYYGATAHLRDAASKWLITLTEHMQPEDRNLSYLVRKMRKKYGSRDNMFRIQQRLAARVQQPGERLSDYAASLTNIGFGKRIPAESYVEAFINGINNETTATQVRAYEPQTLDEAVQFAEDKCGEYGEGFKVTDWRVAKRRYRENREYGEEGDASPSKKKSTNEAAEQLDWRQLGLGFGGEEPPSFDTNGKAVSGLAKTAKKDPLSLAALQALMLVSAGLGKDSAKATSGNLKAAQARKIIEAENNSATGNQQPGNDAAAGTRWQGQNRNGNTGGGSSFNGGGRGGGGRGFGGGRGRGGRTGLENYGPQDTRPIFQRKAESACNYCGEVGHWWRECHKRLADEETAKRHQTVPAVTSDPGANGAAVTATTTAPGN